MKLFILLLSFIHVFSDQVYNLQVTVDDKGALKSIAGVNSTGGAWELNPDTDDEDTMDAYAAAGIPILNYKDNPNGYLMELYDADFAYCSSFVNMAYGVNSWGKFIKAFLYLAALLYVFLGVAIVADVFMASIEVITASEIEVSRLFATPGDEDDKQVTIKVKVWNETVANLTLLALGSSAPEILLAVLETVTTLGEPAGELGPSTIVGSASFNLFMISAICLLSVPDGEVRRISRIGVFGITAFSSVFAYIWMFLCIVVITEGQVDLWEGFLTFLFFPLLVGVAYAVDVDLFSVESPTSPDAEEGDDEDERVFDDAMLKDDIDKNLTNTDDPDTIAAQVEQDMLGRKSPLWWRINGARLLSGKKPLVTNINQIDTLPVEDDKDTEGKSFESHYAPKVDEMRTDVAFHFECAQYMVKEDAGTVQVRVCRSGKTDGVDEVSFETVNGTAQAGPSDSGDYEYKTGVLVFKKGETHKEIVITIHHDEEVENDEFFCVVLTDPKAVDDKNRTVGLHDPKMASVVIIDVSDPGQFSFADTAASVSEGAGEINIPVLRKGGANDRVTVDYQTRPGTALEGVDFFGVRGTLTFENGESAKTILVKIKNNKEYNERVRDFTVMLSHPTNSATIDKSHDQINISITDDQNYSSIVRQVFDILGSGHDLSTHTWRQQFIDAMEYDGDNTTAMVMHALTFPWKIIFAALPPTDYYGGWATFSSSLAMVGAVTYVVGDLASTWGCMVGLGEAQVALSIVALGTSMPDTFASITATKLAPDADAAIGNITGSNSVNVFLGLGLPWVIATLYHAANGTTYEQPPGTLAIAVGVFSVEAILCLGLMIVREFDIGGNVGALGGTKFSRQCLAALFMTFWVIFLVIAFAQG